MDNRSPRSREILGPRPTPLKIRKDSHKIVKKPPLPPQPPQIHQQEVPRGPVIIYTVSPKIIHTHPNNFMTLVQRLTGKNSSSTEVPKDTSAAFDASSGSVSPAARYAATEKASTSNELGFAGCLETRDQYYHHHRHQSQAIERPSCFHGGILSPGPTSLPSISPEFFSGPTDQQRLSSFFNEFSSVLQPSPATIQSPYFMDIFNNFFDS